MIVLRGGLAAILTFASGKKKLAFLNEKAILEALMGRNRCPTPTLFSPP
ncbi:hypothetical protein G6K86_00005 [Agrobacterium rhizogenes]|nr:hypothetical protein [Rhizobium rhizogenes]